MPEDDQKRITGLYGEMCLAMELHRHGWQVYRAYIDEHIDFIIARYYCKKCKRFSKLESRNKIEKGIVKKMSFPTDRCALCVTNSLEVVTRFIQVKTSAGKATKKPDIRDYSFHAKLRSNVDDRAFYAWIALVKKDDKYTPHFYFFHHSEIALFDDLSIPSYQETDNQKTTLRIDDDGVVQNEGRLYDYGCFNDDFHDNFEKLAMGIAA